MTFTYLQIQTALFFFDTLSESDDTVDDDGHSFNGGANAADGNDDSRSSGNSEKSKKKREFVKRVCLLPKHMLKIFRSTLLLLEGVCQTSSFLKLVHLFPKHMLKILRTNVFLLKFQIKCKPDTAEDKVSIFSSYQEETNILHCPIRLLEGDIFFVTLGFQNFFKTPLYRCHCSWIYKKCNAMMD